MIPSIGVYGLFGLPNVKFSFGNEIALAAFFKAENPNGIRASWVFLKS